MTDLRTLLAAVLHDTIEDTKTTSKDLEERFDPAVVSLVLEVTDDKGLFKETRKRLQVENAARLSPNAKLIKLGDKIANVCDVTATPPAGWNTATRREYLEWTEQVVRGCRGSNPALERRYDEVLQAGYSSLEGRPLRRSPSSLAHRCRRLWRHIAGTAIWPPSS